jgi:hypothetical protein
VNGYGPVKKAKVSNRNDAEIHLHVKATKTNLMTFFLLSSSKDTPTEELTKGKAWNKH